MLKEYVLKPIALLILIPVAMIFFLLGFRSCWQCHKTYHRFQMKWYKLRLFEDSKELTCKECHDILSR